MGMLLNCKNTDILRMQATNDHAIASKATIQKHFYLKNT